MQSLVFPRLADVLLLQLALNVFSETDYRHAIVNSAVLLLARAALETKPQSRADCVLAVYVAALLEEYMQVSRRFVPEAFSLLRALSRFM